MANPAFGTSEFPVGDCGPCNREVLTYVELDVRGNEARHCVHCDAEISGIVRWVASNVLESDGYALVEARTCGNGGGCSAGGCGLRQRL